MFMFVTLGWVSCRAYGQLLLGEFPQKSQKTVTVRLAPSLPQPVNFLSWKMHTQSRKPKMFGAYDAPRPTFGTAHFYVNTSACWWESSHRISIFAFHRTAYSAHICTAVKGLIWITASSETKTNQSQLLTCLCGWHAPPSRIKQKTKTKTLETQTLFYELCTMYQVHMLFSISYRCLHFFVSILYVWVRWCMLRIIGCVLLKL